MTNHIHISLRNLPWLVILLAVGILASGALTRAFADSSEVIRIDDSSGQSTTDTVEIETVEIILSGRPSEDSGEEDSIPIQVVEFDFADVNDDPAEQDQVEIVVVELEPVEVPQGDAPQLDPSQGLHPEHGQSGPNDGAQDGNDTPTEPEQPAVPVPPEITDMDLTGSNPISPATPGDGVEGDENTDNAALTDKCECLDLTASLGQARGRAANKYPRVTVVKDGSWRDVTVTIPYQWNLDCTNLEVDSNECKGTLKLRAEAIGWEYILSNGQRIPVNPIPEADRVKNIEVACESEGDKCADASDKGEFKLEFRLNTTSKLTGNVHVWITTICGDTETTRKAVIDVDTYFSTNVNRPNSDWDGDGAKNKDEKHDFDPNKQ